jgi:hypothetical protein
MTMKQAKDSQTLDLFEIPAVHLCAPGECGYSREVAEGVSLLLAESGRLDRYAVSAEVSRLSGKDVSKHMLDAYASPARIEHSLPFWLAPVLEEVCNSHVLTNWLVDKRGGRVAYGKDALRGELGKLVMLKDQAMKDLNSRIKHIEALLGGE